MSNRSAVKLNERVMVEIGLPVTEWHRPPRLNAAGKRVLVHDLHGKLLWELEFCFLYREVGDALYFMYVPLPADEEWRREVLTELLEQLDARTR